MLYILKSHKQTLESEMHFLRSKLHEKKCLGKRHNENVILVGDFNDKSMNDFCKSYNLGSLIRKSTCYKNPENRSCIDL